MSRCSEGKLCARKMPRYKKCWKTKAGTRCSRIRPTVMVHYTVGRGRNKKQLVRVKMAKRPCPPSSKCQK